MQSSYWLLKKGKYEAAENSMVKLLGKNRETEAKDATFNLSKKLSSEKVLPVKEQVSLTILFYFL